MKTLPVLALCLSSMLFLLGAKEVAGEYAVTEMYTYASKYLEIAQKQMELEENTEAPITLKNSKEYACEDRTDERCVLQNINKIPAKVLVLERGAVYIEDGTLSQARTVVANNLLRACITAERMVKLYPKDKEGYIARADINNAFSSFSMALKDYEKALSLNTDPAAVPRLKNAVEYLTSLEAEENTEIITCANKPKGARFSNANPQTSDAYRIY